VTGNKLGGRVDDYVSAKLLATKYRYKRSNDIKTRVPVVAAEGSGSS
jgi:hypothetical protein